MMIILFSEMGLEQVDSEKKAADMRDLRDALDEATEVSKTFISTQLSSSETHSDVRRAIQHEL